MPLIDTHDPLVQIKITSAVCSFVAILTTVYRLYVRKGRYWIDDAWAAFALLTLFSQIASVFMHVDNPAEISKLSRVAAYYLMAIAFYCIIWASRISILFSIIRIDPNPDRRRVYVWASVVYFLACLVMVIQLFWVCEPEPSWKDEPSPQCHLTLQVAICQLVTDILADLFLLVAPLRVLMHLQDKKLRKKLIIIFSTCIITTIVSLVHAAYILTTGGIRVIISAIVEDCMSLLVANVPVVVTAMMRLSAEDKRPEHTSRVMSTVMNFASRKFGFSTHAGTTATRPAGATQFTTHGVEISTYTTTQLDKDMGVKSIGSSGGTRTTMSGTTTDHTGDPIMLDLLDRKKLGTDSKGSALEEEEHEEHKRNFGDSNLDLRGPGAV